MFCLCFKCGIILLGDNMHLAIIMDGNGRYGIEKYGSRSLGHRDGANKLKEVSRWCFDAGVKYLTVYAFSTENWKRSHDEVEFLMKLFREMFTRYIDECKQENIKINVIGDYSRFSNDLIKLIDKAILVTKNNNGLVLNIALNYGGRDEVKRCIKKIIADQVDIDSIDENLISSYLDTSALPDVDLMIRTGGETRLSNFMLWQLSYSELYFTDVLWPDFSRDDLENALTYFKKRDRRFGGVKS